jgi:Cu/Ag efflux protein CusF
VNVNASKTCLSIASIALLTAASAAAQQAEGPPPARNLPGVAIGAGVTAVATVEAVNQETREVTLRKEDGSSVTFVAGDEVRNLAQVRTGDRVIVEYDVGLLMALSEPGTAAPARADVVETARAPVGARPAGAVRRTVAATGTVIEIDERARTVTLRGPRQTVTLPVQPDIDLSEVEVGDRVEALYQETLGIRVEPVAE